MMKSVAALALVASATAFAPAQQARQSTSLAAFESELGAQPPLGFYDPLGFLDNADQETFDRLRYVELKHGRVSQLAFLGQITTRAGLHLPGDIDYHGNAFADFPNGLAAINGPDAISSAGLLQIAALVAVLEIRVMTDVTGESEFRGDFRNGFDFGWDKQVRSIEYSHSEGRFWASGRTCGIPLIHRVFHPLSLTPRPAMLPPALPCHRRRSGSSRSAPSS